MRHAEIAISWKQDGKRKRNLEKNHPKGKTGPQFQSWTDATRVAKERDKWRGLVKGPILLRERLK